MTASARTCPRDGCHVLVDLASMDEVVRGLPIWSCSAGHHGPHIVGFEGYSA